MRILTCDAIPVFVCVFLLVASSSSADDPSTASPTDSSLSTELIGVTEISESNVSNKPGDLPEGNQTIGSSDNAISPSTQSPPQSSTPMAAVIGNEHAASAVIETSTQAIPSLPVTDTANHTESTTVTSSESSMMNATDALETEKTLLFTKQLFPSTESPITTTGSPLNMSETAIPNATSDLTALPPESTFTLPPDAVSESERGEEKNVNIPSDIAEVNVSLGSEVTHSPASSAAPLTESPLVDPVLGPVATTGPAEASSNNLIPSDSLTSEQSTSPSASSPSPSDINSLEPAAVREMGEENVNHEPSDHPEGHPDAGNSDDPISPSTASLPTTTTTTTTAPAAREPEAEKTLLFTKLLFQTTGSPATTAIPSDASELTTNPNGTSSSSPLPPDTHPTYTSSSQADGESESRGEGGEKKKKVMIAETAEVNVSLGSEVTHSPASSASSSAASSPEASSSSESPLDPRLDPSLIVGSAPAATGPSELPSGNNLLPSDSLTQNEQSSSPSSPSPSDISPSEPAAVKGEIGEANVNNKPGDHAEGRIQEVVYSHSDDPISPSTASPPPSSIPVVLPEEDEHPVNAVIETSTQFIPSLPVTGTTNHTAPTTVTGSSSNMTNEAEAKCNHENSSSASSKYNLSGFRLNTFEAAIWIFILIFVICAVFVLLFVLTIFHRKGNHTFDFQASRNQTPTVFQMRGKFLQENRMLRGYDLNSADQILKDEESNFPLNHLNPRVQHLDSYHHYLHPHPHFSAGVRRGSSGGGGNSSPPNRHKQHSSKYTTDPHASANGISLKPIYLPRPVANAMPVTGSHSNSPTNDSGRLVSQSLYPYNLARLSPSERNRVFYQKRIPGGANILVNDAWMVLPLDPVRRNSCYSCSSSVREDRSVCDGCRRHSCPVVDPMSTLDQTMDRNSSSSRGSRDSYTNNNNRNESNLNQKMNMNNSQHHAFPNHRSSPSKKNNNKYSNDEERTASLIKSPIVVNDVTDTKL